MDDVNVKSAPSRRRPARSVSSAWRDTVRVLAWAVGCWSGATAAAAPATATVPGDTNLPLITIRQFLDGARTWGETQRVRLRGIVTHSSSDKTYFIQDGQAGVYAFHKPPTAFAVGQWVEVIGLPSLAGLSPTLQHCSAHALGTREPPAPQAVKFAEALSGRHHMTLVRLRGRLTAERPRGTENLVIDTGDGTNSFIAHIEGVSDAAAFERLEAGSVLELTGVCAIRTGSDRRPRSLTLFIRSAADVVVLSGPPWWTRERTLAVLRFTGIGLALALAWLALLRRQVRVQTGELRRRLENETALEQRYRTLFNANPDPIMIVGANDERILEVNPAFERLMGYSAAEVTGRTTSEFGLWVDPAHRAATIEQLRETGSVTNVESRLKTKDGRVLTVLGSGAFMKFGGQPCYLSFTRDITRSRQIEEHFRQSQRLESIGQLAGGVAHDFNNILGAILGNVALARMDVGETHPARESLEEIKRAGHRAKNLVQQILAFSRQQPAERRVISLGSVIEETASLIRATTPAGIELVKSVAEDAPHVLADATQIHQVIVNLCTNAWHALEGRPGRIEVRLRAVAWTEDAADKPAGLRPGAYACLSISDNGKGMDAATLEHIFDPFFTTKQPGEGTGLGLSVVHGIMRSHEGAITVVSQPGQGTTFRLYFPAVAAAPETPPVPEVALPQGRGQRILYLDDEEPMVLLATRMLGRLGYQVTGCTRAAEALEKFRQDPGQFDLVVTDLNMPGPSGLQVASEVLKVKSDAIVVLSSGHITEDLQQQAQRIGIRHVLYKPNTAEELSETIHRLVIEAKQP